MFRSVLILFLLGCGSTCAAQECRVESRVSICVAGFCKYDGFAGNGVYVGRNDDNSASLVATAAHVLDGRNPNAKVERVTVDGAPAEILGRWYEQGGTDLALLRVAGPADRLAVHALEMPPTGSAISMTGIVDNERRTVAGILIDAERRRGRYGGGSGWSGSGVYGKNGELLGVHNEKVTEQDGSWYRRFTSVRRLDQFADHYAPDLKTGREIAEKGVAIAAATPAPTTRQGSGAGAPGDAGGQWKPSKADNGDAEPDAAADSSSSLIDKGKDLAKDVAGSAAAAAVKTVSDPNAWASGAFTGGAGTAATFGLALAGELWRRRRKRRLAAARGSAAGKPSEEPIARTGANGDVWREPTKNPPPPIPAAHPPVARPVEIPGLSELQKQVSDLTAKLELRDSIAQDSEELARKVSSNLEGLLVGEMIGRDGKPTGETSLWQNGVRLAKQGGLAVNVLGGKAVATEIEKHVLEQAAKAAGTTL